MADRRVRLILEAQVDQFSSNLRKAQTEAEGLGGKLRTAINRPEMQRLGRQLTAFGGVTVGALGMATSAAIDWETAWIDVMRRTEGTPQQLNELEGALRGIATELPTTHQEVAEVAAAAAQLGVHVNDVEEFTRVMIAMGTATNMTAEQAATSMQRFANIMGTPTEDMDRLGSAIVDLGNNSATTESEMMDMGLRLAGAGRQAGMSEGDIMGLAAAMSSMGLEAQAGGTALSRTMTTIGLEVDTNGDKLEQFASVAGMTSQEFAAAWEEDAASALLTFIDGLGRSEERGESMNETLANLGITAIRESDALRRLASDTDLVSDSIDRGNDAWDENTAMMQEAEYVYDSVASQLRAFWSNIQDAAITIGQAFLPVLETMVTHLSAAVDWFGNLPAPIQQAVGWLAALTGGAALAVGSFILLAPGIMASATALSALGLTGPRVATALGRIARGAHIAALAVGGLMIANDVFDPVRTSGNAEQFAGALDDLANGSEGAEERLDALSEQSIMAGGSISSLGQAFDLADPSAFVDGISTVSGFLPGINNMVKEASSITSEYDAAMAHLIGSGNIEAAGEGLRYLSQQAGMWEMTTEELVEKMPQFEQALRDTGIEAHELVDAMGWAASGMTEAGEAAEFGGTTIGDLRARMSEAEEDALAAALGVEDLDDALGDMAGSAEEAEASLRDLVDALVESGILTRDVRAAARDFEQALDNLTASIEENGTTLDTTTEAGRRNEAALDAIADAGVRSAQSLADNGAANEDIQAELSKTYDRLVEAAGQFGITGEEAASLAAEILGVPETVSISSDMDENAANVAAWLNAELDRADGRRTWSRHDHTITTTERRIMQRSSPGNRGNMYGYSTGGSVIGPGTGTSDDIAAWLSNGEHVLTARDVQAMGGQRGVYNFRESLHNPRPPAREMMPAYSVGGAVPRGGGGGVATMEAPVTVQVSMAGALVGSREIARHLADDMSTAIQSKVINRRAKA